MSPDQILEKIFATTHLCIVYLDNHFNFIRVSQAYADTCGQDRSFFPGKNLFDLYPHKENKATFHRVLASGEPFTPHANPFEFPDQQERGITYWDWTLEPIKDETTGEVDGLIFTLVDITMATRHEQQLGRHQQEIETKVEQQTEALKRQAEENLRFQAEIMANMTDGVMLCRFCDGLIIFANQKFEQLFAYGSGELLGRHVSILNAPSNKNPQETAGEIMAAVQSKEVWQGEVENCTKEGRLFWTEATVTVFDHADHGRVCLSIQRDISATKQTEHQLHSSEQRNKIILSRCMDGFFTVNKQGRFLSCNDAYCRMLGYTPEELADLSLREVEANESPEDIARHIQTLSERGLDRFESHHRRKDGQLIDVEVSSNYDSSFGDLYFAFVRDITARRLVEKRLQKNERIHRKILRNSMDGFFTTDRQGHFLTANKAYCQMVGYSMTELAEMTIADIEANESPAEVACHTQRILKKGYDRFQTRHRCKDGRSCHIESTVHLDPESGDFFYAFTRDLTEVKEAERLLRHERNRSQKYLDVVNVALIVLNRHQEVTLINQKGCELFGYEETEIIGKNWFDYFLPPRHRDEIQCVFKKLMTGDLEPVRYYENPIVTKDGEERLIAWHHNYLTDDRGVPNGVISSGEDITLRRETEKSLQKAHDQLEERVATRTHELNHAIRRLQEEVSRHKTTLAKLQLREKELERKNKRVAETNTALRVLLKNRDTEKEEYEQDLQRRLQKLVFPLLNKLQGSDLNDAQIAYIDMLRQNIHTILEPSSAPLLSLQAHLTPTEIQVANFIKQRKTNKEIADIMDSSPRTVEKHRDNIRKKIGIKNKKINLRESLLSLI